MDQKRTYLFARFNEESSKRDNVLKIKVGFLNEVFDGGKSHIEISETSYLHHFSLSWRRRSE